ncbi:hypothetical protein GW17_00023610 [Ensete ventricosum]|nr:hypothetical protein GW17_00023610 [Ensete ventricosum]
MAIRVSKGQEAPLYYETTQQSRDDHGIRKIYIPPPSPFAPRARDKPLAHLVRSISRAFNRLTLLTDELALALWTTQEPKPQWSYAPTSKGLRRVGEAGPAAALTTARSPSPHHVSGLPLLSQTTHGGSNGQRSITDPSTFLLPAETASAFLTGKPAGPRKSFEADRRRWPQRIRSLFRTEQDIPARRRVVFGTADAGREVNPGVFAGLISSFNHRDPNGLDLLRERGVRDPTTVRVFIWFRRLTTATSKRSTLDANTRSSRKHNAVVRFLESCLVVSHATKTASKRFKKAPVVSTHPGVRTPAAVAIDFTDGDTSPSRARIPRRIRRRLLRGKSSGGRLSVEEIEAKLRDAELRRQVVYKRKFVSSVVFRLLGV